MPGFPSQSILIQARTTADQKQRDVNNLSATPMCLNQHINSGLLNELADEQNGLRKWSPIRYAPRELSIVITPCMLLCGFAIRRQMPSGKHKNVPIRFSQFGSERLQIPPCSLHKLVPHPRKLRFIERRVTFGLLMTNDAVQARVPGKLL